MMDRKRELLAIIYLFLPLLIGLAFLVGVWIVLSLVVSVTIGRIVLSVIFMLIAHQVLTSIGYLMGMRATAR